MTTRPTLRHVTRRSVLGGLGGVVALANAKAALAIAEDTPFKNVDKALWVWRTPLSALPDLARFVARWGFGTVYYSIPPRERPALRAGTGLQILRNLQSSGVRLAMVAGDPLWADKPHPLPDAIVDLIALQRTTKVFSSIMLDVEPQTLPSWRDKVDRNRLAAGFDTLSRATAQAANAAGLELGLAIHPAFSNVTLPGNPGQTLARAAADTGSELVLMAYRNTPDAIRAQMRKILPDLAAGRAHWRLGITTQAGPDAATISYAGLPKNVFFADCAAIDAHLRQTPASGGYRGLAIHQYATLSTLLES